MAAVPAKPAKPVLIPVKQAQGRMGRFIANRVIWLVAVLLLGHVPIWIPISLYFTGWYLYYLPRLENREMPLIGPWTRTMVVPMLVVVPLVILLNSKYQPIYAGLLACWLTQVACDLYYYQQMKRAEQK